MDERSKSIRVLATPERAQNLELIDMLRNYLDLAERGEAIGMAGVIYLRGSKYLIGGTSSSNRHEQAGALLECAMERLKDD